MQKDILLGKYVVYVRSSDVGVYLHIKHGGEIQSQIK